MPTVFVEGGLLLAFARGLWVAALLSSFGILAFWVLVGRRAFAGTAATERDRIDRSLLRLAWLSLAAAAVMLAVWTVLQSAEIAGAWSVPALLAVLSGTVFGHLVLLQCAGLAASAGVLRCGTAGRRAAAGFAAATTALQAAHGHALAMVDGPSLLLASGAVHLLAAGGWLGGLAPLLLVVRIASGGTGAAAARWFSPLGKWCIALLVGSAVVQFWQLVGGLPGLVGTAYGWMVLVKLGLSIALLGFAAANRYRYAPRLLRPDPAPGRAVLVRSIAWQTGAGVLIVLAAAVLSSLPPAIHEQPVWPFPWRPSLVVLDDPDLRSEVVQGAVGLLIGLALLAAGVALRRRWVLALAGVAAGLWMAAAASSHLDLLFVPAYRTSYFQSPTGFAATSIARGAALFPQHCAACHGASGRGDGPAAQALADPPADLTAGHLWAHDDGELFWWLTHGIDGPEGGLVMPGYADRLSASDRWALIDYIRGHNAGITLHDGGAWPVPVQAPGFAVSCPGSRTATTTDLRGSILRIVATDNADPAPAVPSQVKVTTVLLAREHQPASRTACVTTDPAVWDAFAVLLGVPSDDLAGAQLLVDQNGWLRDAQRPGAERWADPALLLADMQAIWRTPIAAAASGHAHH